MENLPIIQNDINHFVFLACFQESLFDCQAIDLLQAIPECPAGTRSTMGKCVLREVVVQWSAVCWRRWSTKRKEHVTASRVFLHRKFYTYPNAFASISLHDVLKEQRIRCIHISEKMCIASDSKVAHTISLTDTGKTYCCVQYELEHWIHVYSKVTCNSLISMWHIELPKVPFRLSI